MYVCTRKALNHYGGVSRICGFKFRRAFDNRWSRNEEKQSVDWWLLDQFDQNEKNSNGALLVRFPLARSFR